MCPRERQLLYMLSWMIGTVVGLNVVGWMPALPPLTTLIAALSVSVMLCLRAPVFGKFLSGLSLGLLYATLWGQQLLAERLPGELESVLVQIQGRVSNPPQVRTLADAGQRQRFQFEVESLRCLSEAPPDCPPFSGRVLLSYYGEQRFQANQRWQLIARLKQPWGLANPGSFNFQSWLAARGMAATGYIRDQQLHQLTPSNWLAAPHQSWRQLIDRELERVPLAPAQRGILLALSNGDRGAIDSRNWQLLQRLGLNHLVVISGLHVGMIAAVGFLCGRLFGRRSSHICAFVLAAIYAAQAGFALPTLRALIMLASVQLIALSGRRIQALHTLSLAALGVGLLTPLATHSAGYWLSFGAVSLIFLRRAQRPELSGWRFWLSLQFVLSLCMGLLASFWFGGISLLAPPANLLAIPVVSFWIAPLCLLASLLVAVAGELSHNLWELAALPLQLLLAIDENWTGAGWLYLRPTVLPLLAALCAVLLGLAHRALPVRWLAIPLLLSLGLPGQRLPADQLRLSLLDVGQGLAVVVQSGAHSLLLDTGAGDPRGPNMATAVVLPYLERQAIRQLDLMVISHGDRDHASGTQILQQRLDISESWGGGLAADRAAGMIPCRAGMQRWLGQLHIRVLWPPPGRAGSSNNLSCVLLLEQQGFRILLPGDIEKPVELALTRQMRDELAADLLVLPHHGSKSSSSGPFLRAVLPRVGLASAGYRNRFGHPHKGVLQRLQQLEVLVFNTAEHGAVIIEVEAGQLTGISRWREVRHYYWH